MVYTVGMVWVEDFVVVEVGLELGIGLVSSLDHPDDDVSFSQFRFHRLLGIKRSNQPLNIPFTLV